MNKPFDIYATKVRLHRGLRTDRELDTELLLILEQCAVAGKRCPTFQEFRDEHQFSQSWSSPVSLAMKGLVMVEIYSLNWRVVHIMTGPHKGKHTKMPIHKHGRPYKTYYKKAKGAV